MAKDAIKEEIDRTIQNLEDQLKREGFKESDIDELKADLEVEIKKQSSLTEVIGVIKEAKKKVQKKNGKKVFSDESSFDSLMDDFKDYEATSDLEEEVNIEEIEESEIHEDRPALENTVGANNKYFSQGSPGEEQNIAYMSQEDHVYESGGPQHQKEVSQAVRDAQEKEQEMIAYRTTGKVKRKEVEREFEDPSSAYR